MHTPESLIDIHKRTHHSFKKLLEHCGQLTADELHRKMPDFGYPTVKLQLDHMIRAERYWVGVLHGRIDIDGDIDKYPTIESLEVLRQEVYGVTSNYLAEASVDELNTPRPMTTWDKKEKLLVPAQIIIRTQTHIFQHQGQIAAMCRSMGKPIPSGLDFPILPLEL